MEEEGYARVPPGGLQENYLSLDDVLMTHGKVPCRVEVALPRLGFLDKSSDDAGLPAGKQMELPLWMAKGLSDRRRVVSVETPRGYRQGWRTVLGADPGVVDLHKMGPYYYALGTQLLHFESPESGEIAQALLQAFSGRFRRVMDACQNAFDEDTSALTAPLDVSERALFRRGQRSLEALAAWEQGRASQLTASAIVSNMRKRKLADLDRM
ncbi:DNA replication complex GINS protein PSF3 [Lampetra fluviatilis]